MAWDQSTGGENEKRQSVHILIEGLVQGVGFRAFVERRAVGLGLDGWVRNRRDGGVEAVIAGEAAQVERMLALCRQGPPQSRVDMLKVIGEGADVPPGFVVRPTS